MIQRVSHGSCAVCGGSILYMGSAYCSPQCNAAAYQSGLRQCTRCGQVIPPDNFLDVCVVCEVEARPEPARCALCRSEVEDGVKICAACVAKTDSVMRPVLVLDVETELITDAVPAPPLVCAGFANPKDYWLFHVREAREPIEVALRSDSLIVGHNVAFDMAVICYEWPDLFPLVFDVYEQDRVTDTMLREMLVDIAEGAFIKGRTYSLEECVLKRCRIQLEKGVWETRFAELKPYPIEQWPEGARRYVSADVVTELALYREQEKDAHWFKDQFRQARHAFAAQLTSIWGLRTDPESVYKYKSGLVQERLDHAQHLVAAGLMRPRLKRDAKLVVEGVKSLSDVELVRSVKKVQERVEAVYASKGKKAPRTPASKMYAEGQVHADADTCKLSGDPLLAKYADLLSIDSMLSNYVPVLEKGTVNPIHARYNTLLVTGRTSTSPNTQNYPTEEGVRECFAPRPGYVFIIVDYAGIELRTWAQICYGLFKQSKLREALNAGVDPHTKMASLILGISYEQAVAEYAENRKGRVYLPRQAGKAGNFGFPGGAGYESWREYARTAYGVDVPKDDPSAPIDAKRIKAFWREAWPESELYHDWATTQCEIGGGLGLVEQAFVGRFRGGCRFTELSNSLFQALAADLAKYAWFLICKACYAQPESPLYGSRPVNFIHDEVVTETLDNGNAHDAAKEQERIMIEAAKPFLPDITNIECETLLARRWSKAAKPVYDNDGRLIPWEGN